MFLAYAVPGAGRALIDLELYLPRAWTDDRDRCRQAGIPDDRCFAAKPELARQMINRALEAGELAFFTCHAPAGTALAELVQVAGLIAVTAGEIRRLLTAFTHPQHPGEHYQHWSRWRRHHQAQARQPHYQRRLTNQPLPMTCQPAAPHHGVSARLTEAVSPGSGTDRPTSAGLCPLASR